MYLQDVMYNMNTKRKTMQTENYQETEDSKISKFTFVFTCSFSH